MQQLEDSYESDFNGQYLEALDRDSIIEMLEINEKSFDELIERTLKKCQSIGRTHLFRSNLNYSREEVCEIGFIGLYYFVLVNSDLKIYQYFEKYIPALKEACFEESLKLLNNFSKPKPKRKGIKNPEFDHEQMMEIQGKKIAIEFKIPDLEGISDRSHSFYNKNIVITGTFDSYPVRNEMAEIICKVGGKVKATVGKSTDFVILGSNAGPAKLKTIENLNIETLTEKQFLDLFKN